MGSSKQKHNKIDDGKLIALIVTEIQRAAATGRLMSGGTSQTSLMLEFGNVVIYYGKTNSEIEKSKIELKIKSLLDMSKGDRNIRSTIVQTSSDLLALGKQLPPSLSEWLGQELLGENTRPKNTTFTSKHQDRDWLFVCLIYSINYVYGINPERGIATDYQVSGYSASDYVCLAWKGEEELNEEFLGQIKKAWTNRPNFLKQALSLEELPGEIIYIIQSFRHGTT